MTMDQLQGRIAGRFVNRHAGQCFVTTRDPAEVDEWRQLSGTTRDASIASMFLYELHLPGLLDFVGEPQENEDDPVRDARPRICLEHFRARDGYSWPCRESWL